MPAPQASRPVENDSLTIVVPGEARVPEIVSLTSLRGIAAMLVALFHFRTQLHAYFPLSDYTHILDRGYIWVDFFFILSGFIMCYVYGDMFSERITMASVKRFLILRFVRIYPLHFATLMAFVAIEVAQLVASRYVDLSMLVIFTEQASPFNLVMNVLLLHGFGVTELPGWNEPSWSISVEMGLYLLFPLLAVSPLVRSREGMIVMIVAAFVFLGAIEWRVRANPAMAGEWKTAMPRRNPPNPRKNP